MNRSTFLKRLGIGALAAVVAPKVIDSVTGRSESEKRDDYNRTLIKNPRTPAEVDMFQYRGGYNCRHYIEPVNGWDKIKHLFFEDEQGRICVRTQGDKGSI